MWLGQGHLDFWQNGPLMLTLGMSSLAVLFASVIACSVTSAASSPLNRVLSAGVLRSFGG